MECPKYELSKKHDIPGITPQYFTDQKLTKKSKKKYKSSPKFSYARCMDELLQTATIEICIIRQNYTKFEKPRTFKLS